MMAPHSVTSFTISSTMRLRPSRDMARELTPWRISLQERECGGLVMVRLMR